MSIPVLNKIKILSAVSPSLANPHPTSPALSTRGAVVAIEGADSNTIWSMTNSLRAQLEKDGKFVVKVFTGPDVSTFFGGGYDPVTGQTKSGKNPLGTADVLKLVEEWHKVSDEMRAFITTRPGGVTEIMPEISAKRVHDVEMSEDGKDVLGPTHVETGPISESQASDVAMTDDASRSSSTPDRVKFDLPASPSDSKIREADQDKTTTPNSAVSPKTLSKTSDLTITTPPVTRSLSHAQTSPASASMPPPPAKVDSLPPSPSYSTTPAIKSAAPIPIALIPSYQLSTTNALAITTPISDAYSPGSHWQWVAALWRGAIGPDVTIAIRAVPSSGSEDAMSEPPLSDERLPGHANGPPRDRMGSIVAANAVGRGGSMAAPAKVGVAGPGVEVRLLDYRAVVVRTMGVDKKMGGEEEKKSEEFWEKAKRRVGFEVAEFLRR